MPSRNKVDLNDVTVAPFSVSFSQLPAVHKTLKTGQLWYHWGPSYFVTTLVKKIDEESRENKALQLILRLHKHLKTRICQL